MRIASSMALGWLTCCSAPPGSPAAVSPVPVAAVQGLAAGEVELRFAKAWEAPLRYALYDSSLSFGDPRGALRTGQLSPEGARAYRIVGLAPGRYALNIYADENRNGVLDRNFLGIPIEPVGFSNGYVPKGPPVFELAAFSLSAGETLVAEVTLDYVLGEFGQFGVGPGAVGRSSPYRGSSANVLQPIPAITFLNDSLSLLGPTARIGLAGSEALRLAAALRFRVGPYEEDDSPFLAGLGDRDSTLLGGLAAVWDLPRDVDIDASYEHDLLGRIGGGEARLGIEKTLPWGRARFSPKISGKWVSAELANHDFGVPASGAIAGRPAYELDDVLSLEVGLGIFAELSENWRLVANVGVEFLSSEVRRSPIVDEDEVIFGFVALNYLF